MAKRKLIKRKIGARGTIKKSRTIKVQDEDGNEHVLRATVIGVSTDNIRKERSNSIIDNALNETSFGSKIVKPPLPQRELSMLSENSSELTPNIEAMAVGIEGFGQKIIEREMTDKQKTKFSSEIKTEKLWLDTHVLKYPNPDGGLRKLRKELLKDRESTGNSYCELVPSLKGDGKYSCYNRIEPSNILITKADKVFTRFKVRFVNSKMELKNKMFQKRFRRFVQIVGTKKVFFKEFLDPRPIDARNGDVLKMRSNRSGNKVPVDANGDEVDRKFLANELKHFKIGTSRRTPYGMPRFTGNIVAIKGSRSSEEANILTLQNNNVPSMAVLVSGGMLTEGSLARIQDFVDQNIKSDLNYSKFLLLEGEGNHDSLSGASSMKIEIKPLTNDQHTDALWSEYDEKNNTKVRRSFRQPPVLVGNGEIDKAKVRESEKLAEKYIYNPEREDLDEEWNKIIVQQGTKFHVLKGQSPNVTDDEDLVKIISNAEKTGGMTPRIAHMILEDILNRKLPPLKEDDPDFNPDLPFSISVGKLARGMAISNGEGTLAPRGQSEADKGKDNRDKSDLIDQLHNDLDPHLKLQREFLGALEDILDIESFGKVVKELMPQKECIAC